MSTHYGYETDDDLIEDLSERIVLKRLEDVIPGEDYVLHASYWWRVVGADWGTSVLYLEIAGPTGQGNPATAVLVRDEGDLVVTSPASSDLQFQEGTLLDVPWPDSTLIYVKNARRLGAWDASEEQVSGIFVRQYGPDGDPYYAQVDSDRKPGAAPGMALLPGSALVLDWEPVDVAGLLRKRGRGDD